MPSKPLHTNSPPLIVNLSYVLIVECIEVTLPPLIIVSP